MTRAREKPSIGEIGTAIRARKHGRVSGGRDLEEEVCVIGWGKLAGGGVGAVARRLAFSRARDVLGPGGGDGRGDGGRLGRAPRASRGPIGAGAS